MHSIYSIGFSCLLFVGMLGLLFTAFYWRKLATLSWISELWLKIFSKSILFIVGSAGVYAAYIDQEERKSWFTVAILGAMCVFVWELLLAIVESRIKSIEKSKQLSITWLSELVAALRGLIDQRVSVLSQYMTKSARKNSVKSLRVALKPQEHMEGTLYSLLQLFKRQLSRGELDSTNFRAAIYVDKDDKLVAIFQLDLMNPGSNVFTSYLKYPEHFDLTRDDLWSLAGRSLNLRRTIFVADCVIATSKSEFVYMHEAQKTYLKSIVAFHLGEVCLPNGTMTRGVLAIDTNRVGFFDLEKYAYLEVVLQEFAARIKLELLLLAATVQGKG